MVISSILFLCLNIYIDIKNQFSYLPPWSKNQKLWLITEKSFEKNLKENIKDSSTINCIANTFQTFT